MSSAKIKPEFFKSSRIGKPLIGSLLRLPRDHIVARMLVALNEQGFDLSEKEIAIFMYPGPHGRRPIELARQCLMSRQAMNYVLAELEQRGYLERHSGQKPVSTIVQLTERGWAMLELMRRCVATVESEWMEHLGEERFGTLKDTLFDLSDWLGKLPS